MVIFSYGNFPKYCGMKIGVFGVWSDKNLVYNATTNQMIEGCIESTMQHYQGTDNVTALNVLCPAIIVIFAVFSAFMRPVLGFFGYTIAIKIVSKDDNQVVEMS
jgi:hypothetical protein